MLLHGRNNHPTLPLFDFVRDLWQKSLRGSTPLQGCSHHPVLSLHNLVWLVAEVFWRVGTALRIMGTVWLLGTVVSFLSG